MASRMPRPNNASEAMADILAGLAKVRSERELQDCLIDIAGRTAGATAAAILTREPRRPVPSRTLRLRSAGRRPSVEEAGSAVVSLLDAGHPAIFTRKQLPQLGRPTEPDSELAIIVPCTGPGSDTALFLEWKTAAPQPDPDMLDRLRVVALVAGQTLERLDAEQRESLTRAEMENRIKNTIAVVRSLAARSALPATSLEEFSLHFEGRLDAMARVQVAFARSGPRVQLEQLVQEELFSQGIEERTNVSIRGMSMSLDAPTAETLCLALHELAVNAVKFGAFAEAGGSLVVRWWLEMERDKPVLKLRWSETTQFPTDPKPAHYGFGRTFLERVLPFEIDARTNLVFGEAGIRCEISIPVPGAERGERLVTKFPMRQSWVVPPNADS